MIWADKRRVIDRASGPLRDREGQREITRRSGLLAGAVHRDVDVGRVTKFVQRHTKATLIRRTIHKQQKGPDALAGFDVRVEPGAVVPLSSRSSFVGGQRSIISGLILPRAFCVRFGLGVWCFFASSLWLLVFAFVGLLLLLLLLFLFVVVFGVVVAFQGRWLARKPARCWLLDPSAQLPISQHAALRNTAFKHSHAPSLFLSASLSGVL